MGSNPGYLLKSFLLKIYLFIGAFRRCLSMKIKYIFVNNCKNVPFEIIWSLCDLLTFYNGNLVNCSKFNYQRNHSFNIRNLINIFFELCRCIAWLFWNNLERIRSRCTYSLETEEYYYFSSICVRTALSSLANSKK